MDFTLSLPDWAVEENAKIPLYYPTVEERMAEVIRFSRLNVDHGVDCICVAQFSIFENVVVLMCP